MGVTREEFWEMMGGDEEPPEEDSTFDVLMDVCKVGDRRGFGVQGDWNGTRVFLEIVRSGTPFRTEQGHFHELLDLDDDDEDEDD